MEQVYEFLPIILLVVFLLLLYFLSVVYFMRRSITRAIKTLREHKAVKQKQAKDREELGLIQRRGIAERLAKGPDYMPHALHFLTSAEVVQETDEGLIYLSEKKLSSLQKKRDQDGQSPLKLWKLILPRGM